MYRAYYFYNKIIVYHICFYYILFLIINILIVKSKIYRFIKSHIYHIVLIKYREIYLPEGIFTFTSCKFRIFAGKKLIRMVISPNEMFLVQLGIAAGFMVNTIPKGFGERGTFIARRSTFVIMVIIFFSD